MIVVSDSLCGKSLLLAVSGGVDSVCLLDFFAKNKTTFQIQNLGVAHVDHGVRGQQSADDALFVKRLAERYNIPFYFKSLGNSLCGVSNFEAAAREARYQFLQECKAQNGFDFVVTAHHLNDQAETVYMRLARGTSLFGLRGILKFRPDGIYRPFLHISKSEILDYAQTEHLEFCEDASNADTTFRRNFIRNVLFPAAKENDLKNMETLSRQDLNEVAISFNHSAVSPLIYTLGSLAENANRIFPKLLNHAEKTFAPFICDETSWPFPAVFSPYRKTLALDLAPLQKTIERLGPGGEELFRLWLDSQGFSTPPGKNRPPLFPFPENRRFVKNVLIEKARNRLWFFETRSIFNHKNLYFFLRRDDSFTEWRFRKDGDVYWTHSRTNGKPSKRKLTKWLQELGIPQSVRHALPFLVKDSVIVRMAKESDISENFKS